MGTYILFTHVLYTYVSQILYNVYTSVFFLYLGSYGYNLTDKVDHWQIRCSI